MRSSRIAITLLVVALVAAFAVPGAIACDKTAAAKAETASMANCDPANCDPASCTKGAEATTASTTQAGTCESKTAAAQTASATGCSKSAASSSATTVAGTGCASKTSATQTAGAGCSSSQASAAKYDIAIQTVKMPSGALAVMYSGNDADTVAMLHSAANGTAADFGCPNVQNMVATEGCSVEMASTENGLIFLCTSDDVALIESFQKSYEVAAATPVEEEQGE